MVIKQHATASRGVHQLMYVGDDEADNAKARGLTPLILAAAGYALLAKKSKHRMAAGGIAVALFLAL